MLSGMRKSISNVGEPHAGHCMSSHVVPYTESPKVLKSAKARMSALVGPLAAVTRTTQASGTRSPGRKGPQHFVVACNGVDRSGAGRLTTGSGLVGGVLDVFPQDGTATNEKMTPRTAGTAARREKCLTNSSQPKPRNRIRFFEYARPRREQASDALLLCVWRHYTEDAHSRERS
jgi:hypothetical protein